MKLLASSFFDYLTQVTSKRHPVGVWGIDPKWLLGKSGGGENALAKEVLEVIGYSFNGECEHCGAETSAPDSKALEYALDLWSELGSYLESRWAELHEIEEEHAACGDEACCESEETCEECNGHLCENEEEHLCEVELCSECETELDVFGVCPACEEEETDEVEEADDEEEEDDSDSDDEDEEEDDTCSDCGSDLDDYGECTSCEED
jgi:hypothetical protein